ncbi:MAG: KOW domain-containing RNA-binding protein [Lachnospiraceae bacterium]|nr:KOW domain-containing RNA-binding protein [Lachnospiraceae bacterium]MDE7007994.1 KOW domain-containing RNA-binding protein [Lachnospiraceae bacterium]
MLGMFAVSKAGHDKGRMYLVIRDEGDTVYLADGKIKTLENPKRKKKKHLQIIKKDIDQVLMQKLINEQKLYNEEIKHAIKIRANKEVTYVEG